jgi:hypothetical protein
MKTRPRRSPVVGLSEQRFFAETPPAGGESKEQTLRRWEAFLQSIRH